MLRCDLANGKGGGGDPTSRKARPWPECGKARHRHRRPRCTQQTLDAGWTVVDAKSARIEAAAEKASGSSSSTAAAETATTEAATEHAVAAKHTFSPGRKEWAGWAKPKKRWEQALDTFNVVFASFLKEQQVDSVVPQPFVSGLAERLKEKSPPKKKRIVTEWGLIIEVGEPASKGLNYTSGYSTTTGLRGRGACFS